MSRHRENTRDTDALAEIKEEVMLEEWQKQIEERCNEGDGRNRLVREERNQ